MINRNSFWIAFVAAVLLPFVGYAIILSIYEQMESIGWVSPIGLAGNFRIRTVAMIAVCLNIILIQYYNRKKYTESIKGVGTATIIYSIIWVFYFGRHLF